MGNIKKKKKKKKEENMRGFERAADSSGKRAAHELGSKAGGRSKGGEPTSIMYSTTPVDQRSTLSLYCRGPEARGPIEPKVSISGAT